MTAEFVCFFLLKIVIYSLLFYILNENGQKLTYFNICEGVDNNC